MLWSLGIDSKELIPVANVAWARICKRLRSPGVRHTDTDRNRALEKPPAELIPCRWKPLRRTRLLRNLPQTQVWREQVWLNTTFISQGSQSWDKLAVET